MKSTLAISLIFALCTSVVHADLRYTTRVDLRRIADAAAEPAPEIVAVLQSLVSAGETRVFVSADALRVEQGDGATATVLLARSDGQFILYPGSRAYARAPLPGGGAGAVQTPAPVLRRTGEFATMLGLRAERVLVTLTVTLPITPPPGFPSAMTLEGELWLANAYSAEARSLRKLMGPLAAVTGGVEGIVLRHVLRVAQLGYEVETRVTELAEGPIDASLFAIPAGYRPLDELLTPGSPGRGNRRLP